MVAARCPGGGEVVVEIWAGDPGLEAPWTVVFDAGLETLANGFAAGDFSDWYQVDARPGRYRVRADVLMDRWSQAEAVRFVFPQNPDLSGQPIATT